MRPGNVRLLWDRTRPAYRSIARTTAASFRGQLWTTTPRTRVTAGPVVGAHGAVGGARRLASDRRPAEDAAARRRPVGLGSSERRLRGSSRRVGASWVSLRLRTIRARSTRLIWPFSSETTTTTASVCSVIPRAARWRVPNRSAWTVVSASGRSAPAARIVSPRMMTAPSWSGGPRHEDRAGAGRPRGRRGSSPRSRRSPRGRSRARGR